MSSVSSLQSEPTDRREDRQKLRVLMLVPRWESGGMEGYLQTLLNNQPEDFALGIASMSTTIIDDLSCTCSGPLSQRRRATQDLLNTNALKKYLRAFNADIIHIHASNATSFVQASAAKMAGVPVRIVHSHNASLAPNNLVAKKVANRMLSFAYRNSETDRWACSTIAAQHLFGTSSSVFTAKNGIDTTRFRFDAKRRAATRQSLGIAEQTLLVGFLGRFTTQKNPERVLSLFKTILEKTPQASLLMLGEGHLRKKVIRQSKALGIADHCIIPGTTSQPECYYDACDLLLAPSLFEGLPLTLVEAQCSGLPIVASSSISEEIVLNQTCLRLSLECSDEQWVCACLDVARSHNRFQAYRSIQKNGYDARETAARVFDRYRQLYARAVTESSAKRPRGGFELS
ncbi:MAG: glycosyltransferase [Gordonibacter sp.]